MPVLTALEAPYSNDTPDAASAAKTNFFRLAATTTFSFRSKADGCRSWGGVPATASFERFDSEPAGIAISPTSQSRNGSDLIPLDIPRVQAAGYDLQRTLFLGHATTASLGVTTHNLGLPGYLARQLKTLTRRGQIVDVATTSARTLRGVTASISAQPLWRFDAIVVGLTLPGPWWMVFSPHRKADVTDLVTRLGQACSVDTRAVIAADLFPADRSGQHAFTRCSRRTRASADRLKAECALSSNVRFVELPNPPGTAKQEQPVRDLAYANYAEVIADQLVDSLTSFSVRTKQPTPGSARLKRSERQPEDERQQALDALKLDKRTVSPELRRILALLRSAYDTQRAALNIIDGDTQWSLVVAGGDLEDIKRSDTICDITIGQDTPMVIPDAKADLLFHDYPCVVGGYLGFYAGVAIESPGGLRIGGLCIFDPHPRIDQYFDPLLLTSAVHQVETLLWEHARMLAA